MSTEEATGRGRIVAGGGWSFPISFDILIPTQFHLLTVEALFYHVIHYHVSDITASVYMHTVYFILYHNLIIFSSLSFIRYYYHRFSNT